MYVASHRRRRFLAVLFSTAFGGIETSEASDPPRCIGYLSGGGTPGEWLARPLAKLGWEDGRNLRFEIRLAPPDHAQLDVVAAELVRAKVDVLLTAQSQRVAALLKATRTIPIVSAGVPDPVGSGFAKSLRKPGGNVTGLSMGAPETADLIVGVLKAMRPGLKRIMCFYPEGGPAPWSVRSAREASHRAGIAWDFIPATGIADVKRAFAAVREPTRAAAAMIGVPGAAEGEVEALAIRHRIALAADDPRHGALFDVGLQFTDLPGRVAAILDKILRGGDPADIPFEVPDRMTFVINRATAKAIGVTLTKDLLLRATEIVG